MKRTLAAACVVIGLACAGAAAADPSVNDVAARTELRAFETLTLTDQQFLTGDRNGRPTMIAGQLRIPQNTAGRLPAVILLHGSGGPTAAMNCGRSISTRSAPRPS